MKKIVTVSLGSSKKDFEFTTEFLGQEFSIHRMGADESVTSNEKRCGIGSARTRSVERDKGHDGGDAALKHVCQVVQSSLRKMDSLGRFGGEEFVIILEPIPHEMAERTLERFRNKVADSDFPLIEKITISGGYVKVTDLHYPVTFIEHADQALYYAKKNGRNCMYSYESLVERGELSVQIESGKIDLF